MTHKTLIAFAAILLTAVPGMSQSLPPELKAKVDAQLKTLQAWSADPQIVSAVKAYNAAPPAEAKGMTNEKWKSLTVLDPLVRSFSKNALAVYLKAKQTPAVVEAFVSGSNGCKVAFLSKTTSWDHTGKDKHRVPMTGKTWVGTPEVDESTGQLSVQVGLPVLDGGKPIGSVVVGLSTTRM